MHKSLTQNSLLFILVVDYISKLVRQDRATKLLYTNEVALQVDSIGMMANDKGLECKTKYAG